VHKIWITIQQVSCFPSCKQINTLTHTNEIKLRVKRIEAIEKKKESFNKMQESRILQASQTDPDGHVSATPNELTKVQRHQGLKKLFKH
jgi:hypothetical protein